MGAERNRGSDLEFVEAIQILNGSYRDWRIRSFGQKLSMEIVLLKAGNHQKAACRNAKGCLIQTKDSEPDSKTDLQSRHN